MIEHYATIKTVHVSCALISGIVFAARGALVLAGSALGNHAAARRFSYLNDSVLLLAGLLLMRLSGQYPVAQSWLSVKLSLLLLYIVLGIYALRRGRNRRQRGVFLLFALLVYLGILSVARAHHPLGGLAGVL